MSQTNYMLLRKVYVCVFVCVPTKSKFARYVIVSLTFFCINAPIQICIFVAQNYLIIHTHLLHVVYTRRPAERDDKQLFLLFTSRRNKKKNLNRFSRYLFTFDKALF